MISRHPRSIYATTIPLFGLVLLVGACSKKDAGHSSAAIPPPTVVVERIDQRTVPIYSEYVGQTRAEETVELRARVEGILQKVYFHEGTPVRKGQLLFTIDKRPFEANLQSAKATLAKSIADLAQAKQRTDVLKAQAELADAEATHSKTQQDLARVSPLAKEKAVTELISGTGKLKPTMRDDVIYHTTLPWISFTSFAHARTGGRGESIPRIVFGKITNSNERQVLPISVEVHHALMDGLHVGRFLEHVEKAFSEPESFIVGPT